MTAEIPLNKPVKKNSFLIPAKVEDQKTEKKEACLFEWYYEQIEICFESKKTRDTAFFETELSGVGQA